MSLLAACVWALVRGLAVVLVGVPIAFHLQRRLVHMIGWPLHLAWAGILLPLLAPHLVTGYGYAHFSLSLIHHPIWNELFYDVLLLIGSVPVGIVLLQFAPAAPVSAEAVHCARLARSTRQITWRTQFGIWSRGPVRSLIPPAALMFLLAFQEFEIASMMLVPTWTVWLFDAQVGGLPLMSSLRYAMTPALLEIIALTPVLIVFFNSRGLVARSGWRSGMASDYGTTWLWSYLALSATLFWIVPWAMVLGSSWDGYRPLFQNQTLWSDVLRGLAMATMAGGIVYPLICWLITGTPRSWPRAAMVGGVQLAIVLGLLGPLVVSLVLLSLFQMPMVYRVYDSPLPWLCGLGCFLAPRAWLVVSMIVVARRREPNFLARLLTRSSLAAQRAEGQRLLWRNQWVPHLWGMALLCNWAYLDGTIAAMLAPAAWVSSPVRLYNLMHYGQSSVLSAMVVVTFMMPVVFIAVLFCFHRPFVRYMLR